MQFPWEEMDEAGSEGLAQESLSNSSGLWGPGPATWYLMPGVGVINGAVCAVALRTAA